MSFHVLRNDGRLRAKPTKGSCRLLDRDFDVGTGKLIVLLVLGSRPENNVKNMARRQMGRTTVLLDANHSAWTASLTALAGDWSSNHFILQKVSDIRLSLWKLDTGPKELRTTDYGGLLLFAHS